MTDADARWQEWRDVHQRFERDWWQKAISAGHSVDDAAFNAQWASVREWIKPTGSVLDIGCGPRPPFSPCTVIEPLAEKYQALPEVRRVWWEHVTVLTRPAEYVDRYFVGHFNTVICWNCIDHCADWRGVLDAMLAYGTPGARYALATDLAAPHEGHPGVGSQEEFLAEVFARFKEISRSEGQPGWRSLSLLLEAS